MFHFPSEIKLQENSLVEAWLEIRWKLPPSDIPQFSMDKAFPFALGIFYNYIKNEFGYREELDASKAPEGMLPYIVQYRFRKAKNSWPVLQLGPGIATVNFTCPYSWHDFKEKASYLQEALLNAYQDSNLVTQAVILRYRNAYAYPIAKKNLFEFLRNNLNTSFSLPQYIPGNITQKKNPSNVNFVISFDLEEPSGIGSIKIATGKSREIVSGKINEQEVVVWDLEISSSEKQTPKIDDQIMFTDWLEKAHSVVHEWYFSMIEGNLFSQYNEKGK